MFDLCANLLVPNAIGTYRMSYAVRIQLDGRTDREYPFTILSYFHFSQVYEEICRIHTRSIPYDHAQEHR